MKEEWKSLNGCHTCINTNVCKELGSCTLLVIDHKYPEYTKTKRKMIQKIRTLPANDVNYYVDTLRYKQPVTEEEIYYRSWSGPVRLTVIERMCINELNKPR